MSTENSKNFSAPAAKRASGHPVGQGQEAPANPLPDNNLLLGVVRHRGEPASLLPGERRLLPQDLLLARPLPRLDEAVR